MRKRNKSVSYFSEDYYRLKPPRRAPFYPPWIIRFIRRLCHKTGKRILDVGCGVAWRCKEIERCIPDAEVVLLDISEFAQRYNKDVVRPKASIIIGDAVRLPFQNDSFNLLIAFELIEHISDVRSAYEEFARVLHPKGFLLISTPNLKSIGVALDSLGLKPNRWFGWRDPTHVSILPPRVHKKIAAACGLRFLSCFYRPLWDTPYIKGIPKPIQDVFIKHPFLLFQYYFGPRLPCAFSEHVLIVFRKC